MPAEKVLPLPLSGSEIVEAVLDKLRAALVKDCYLSPNTAYDWFEARVKVHVKANDIGRRPEVKAEVTVGLGEQGSAGRGQDHEVELVIEPAAPNEIRQETGQPLPVLATTADGHREIKKVQYKRQAAAPKG